MLPPGSPQVLARRAACAACPDRVVAEAGRDYCGACRCPKWPVARLELKLRLAGATCPRGRFPQPHEAPHVPDGRNISI